MAMNPIPAHNIQRLGISTSAFYRRWSGVYHRRTIEPLGAQPPALRRRSP
jgi:hypothetical protein